MSTPPPPSSARVAYGIDLTAVGLVVARATRRGKTVRMEGRVHHEAPASVQAEVAAGKAVLAAALPVGASFTRWLRTPFASRAKANKVFPSLLDIQLPFPIEDCVYDFLAVRPTGSAQVETLAVACRNEDLLRRLDELREAGIDPERIDHQGLAMWTRSIDELPVEADTPRVVVYVGHDHCAFALGEGERFLAAYSTRVSAADLTAADSLAVQQFVRRALQVLHLGTPGEPDAEVQWAWCGPGAEDRARLAVLEKALPLSSTRFMTHEEPETFLARALAARALRTGPLSFNFRMGAHAHAAVVKRTARSRSSLTRAALLTGLLLCLANIGWELGLEARKDRLQAEITALATELAGSRVPRGQELVRVGKRLEEQAPMRSAFLNFFQPSPLELVGAILGSAADNQLSLDSLTVRPDFISLRGTSEDWNRCKPLEDFILGRGFAVEMNLPDAGADELVHFSLQARK